MNATSTSRGTTRDWSLLERIARRDEEAFSALYDRYSGMVFSVAKRILHRTGEAEEILQDIFYVVWRSASRFDPSKGSLAGWLLVSARNRAVARLRGKNNYAEEVDENGVRLSIDAESLAEQARLVDKVRGVMSSLPEQQREALECAYFEGMSHGEIALRTGQSPASVKANLHNAMVGVKKVLG